ncbi:uncharacterized protein V2V93DRAFT_362083 [Kockiozyma suomiensis]|uniref:uncharacterized protein n=1 Tax=Kockiozyma suomiensis TaxID=1337062 RepID=UPI003343CE3A
MQAIENLFEFGRNQNQDIYSNNYTPQQHEAKFSHEAIAGAASFAAFKAFEDKQRREGQPVSHAFAKEVLAGFAGAEVDKLIETKGLNFYDREKAKRHAQQQVEQMYNSHYGGDQNYDPQSRPPPREIQESFGGGYGGNQGFDGGYGGNQRGYGGNQGFDGGYGGNQGGYGGNGGFDDGYTGNRGYDNQGYNNNNY